MVLISSRLHRGCMATITTIGEPLACSGFAPNVKSIICNLFNSSGTKLSFLAADSLDSKLATQILSLLVKKGQFVKAVWDLVGCLRSNQLAR